MEVVAVSALRTVSPSGPAASTQHASHALSWTEDAQGARPLWWRHASAMVTRCPQRWFPRSRTIC